MRGGEDKVCLKDLAFWKTAKDTFLKRFSLPNVPWLNTLHGEPVHLKLKRLIPQSPGGENQNSISVTSHGSKRPIRCCQRLEKCKVTVHFTSDSVSVSLAGSPVNSQRAVKVERCRRQTAAPHPPPQKRRSLIDPALLCIPINWTAR